jgi:hypothetical protein
MRMPAAGSSPHVVLPLWSVLSQAPLLTYRQLVLRHHVLRCFQGGEGGRCNASRGKGQLVPAHAMMRGMLSMTACCRACCQDPGGVMIGEPALSLYYLQSRAGCGPLQTSQVRTAVTRFQGLSTIAPARGLAIRRLLHAAGVARSQLSGAPSPGLRRWRAR